MEGSVSISIDVDFEAEDGVTKARLEQIFSHIARELAGSSSLADPDTEIVVDARHWYAVVHIVGDR